MIFNLSQGGVSALSVTAPSGTAITATCQGLTVTGTGTCDLELPIIGTWSISAVLDGTERTGSVNVTAYGEEYEVSFSYSATIVVTTFPLSTVTATKTGQEDLTGTADSSGSCTLTVPAGGLGYWDVTANNGSVSETKYDLNVAAYDNSYPVSLLTLVPDFTVVISGNTYRYKGAAISDSNLTVTPVGLTGWKLWMRTSGVIRFDRLPTAVDYCLVGKGATGSYYHYDTVLSTDYGGDGGRGGAVTSAWWNKPTIGQTYDIVVDSTGTAISGIASVGVGGGAAGGGGGEMYVSYSGPGSGGAGQYAFNSAAFDGVEYGHGGYGGDVNGSGAGTGARGRTDSVWGNPGAGGAGGGQSDNRPTGGNIGILLMRSA